MSKTLFISITAATLALFLVTACAEDNKGTEVTGQTGAQTEPASATEKTAVTGKQDSSVMNQPVNFSTPENVEKSLQKVREQEGTPAYNDLKNALQYLLVYDLSIAHDKEKLYKKLDGRTPEQIIGKMRR